jgi:hypothetical protein
MVREFGFGYRWSMSGLTLGSYSVDEVRLDISWRCPAVTSCFFAVFFGDCEGGV